VAVLATLIALFGPISGAHFNPAVSIIEALRGTLKLPATAAYVLAQIGGCVVGALLAHAMFELPIIQSSVHLRAGPAQWLSEAVATAGLILVVIGSSGPRDAAWRVAAWIGAAYWFTASTSFANPAITIARSLSNTFSGIAPANAPAFIASQLCGALVGLLLAKWLQISPAVTVNDPGQDAAERPLTERTRPVN
jgi:glycerol uptake facilitator-like aquaporin